METPDPAATKFFTFDYVQLGEGWPSGKMSDCNARGRGFKSRSGQK